MISNLFVPSEILCGLECVYRLIEENFNKLDVKTNAGKVAIGLDGSLVRSCREPRAPIC